MSLFVFIFADFLELDHLKKPNVNQQWTLVSHYSTQSIHTRCTHHKADAQALASGGWLATGCTLTATSTAVWMPCVSHTPLMGRNGTLS